MPSRLLTILLLTIGSYAAVAADPAAPAPKLNLLVLGDAGYSPIPAVGPNTKTVAKALADYVRTSPDKFAAVLMPGDMFKTKLKSVRDTAFRRGFEEMYDPKVLPMPFYGILGNHDYSAPATDVELKYAAQNPQSRWKMAAKWYRIDLPAEAPLVTVLMLDSNKDKLSADDWKKQLRWLDGELSKPRATWTLFCAHKPMFSDGSHGDSQTMQKEFGPLLKKYDVDFYLSGHDHVLDHHQVEGWKTSFIISGGGGENTIRAMNGDKAVFSEPTPGFVHLQFTPTSARAFFIDAKLKTLYSFDRTREGKIRTLPPDER